MNEPSNFIYYGSIAVILLVFIYAGFYFFRNTIKRREWKMLIYAGSIILAIAGFFVYVYYWF